MDHPRCTKCRNPIRTLGVSRAVDGNQGWFHPDCWDEFCSHEQETYERQVNSGGLAALIAPYVCSAPVGRSATHAFSGLRSRRR